MDSDAPRPTPVRPAILQSLESSIPINPAEQTQAVDPNTLPVELAPATVRVEWAPALPSGDDLIDAPSPCGQCGYDLRGNRRGALCPECGAVVERSALRPKFGTAGELERFDLRDSLSRAWHTLGFLCLIPIALLSPLPCLLPFGVGFSICFGFAPAFRLFAIRAFARLPDEIRRPIASELAHLKRVQIVELCFVGLIAVYAFVATFGLTDRSITPIYYSLILGWWCVSAAGIGAQLRLGKKLSELCVSPALLPVANITIALRGIRACFSIALIAAGLIAYGTTASISMPVLAKACSIVGLIALVGVSIGFACCAIFARGHAVLLAERIFLSSVLREATGEPIARKMIDQVGARVIAATPPHDDTPIPLA